MFAKKYLIKNKLYQPLFQEGISSDTGIIVVIPCLKEPDIIKTLESLNQCYVPECAVEVIILINHSQKAHESIKKYNANTFCVVFEWIKKNANKKVKYLLTKPIELQEKWAGAGLARKRGMDEAIIRYNRIIKPDGLIVSLDADTIVDKNYLMEIKKFFDFNNDAVGATISFQHQLDGLSEKNREGILLYEKYLKYYKEALSFTGFPHAMYTIGSAFVVTAEAYIKRGGMTRRKAGEDFYFLQNLVQQGRVGEITTTKVYPSSRSSDRVVFGTGASMKKWMEEKEDLTITYNFQAFIDLKNFFQQKEKLFQIKKQEYQNIIKELPEPIKVFLDQDLFFDQLNELNGNCATLKVFNQRFFHLFNAFKVLKYMNFCHQKFYKKVNLEKQILQLYNQSN